LIDVLQTLYLPDFLPTGLNRLTRGKVRDRIRLGKGDRELVWCYARQQGLHRLERLVRRRVSLHLVLPPGQRAPDPDSVWKGTLDSLRHAGLIVDDGPRWLELGTVRYSRSLDGKTRCTFVLIEDL
jgi:hypothetical protein